MSRYHSVIGRVIFALAIAILRICRAATAQETVLLKSNFADIKDNWQVWDDPSASPEKSHWRLVLSEYSGIRNDLEEPATIIISGKENWTSYAVKSNLYCQRSFGGLTGIVFGYQGPERYQIAGYNFTRDRFELAERTPGGFAVLAFADMEFPRQSWTPLRLEFRGTRILFLAGGRTIFDLEDARFEKGRAGLGTSWLKNGDILLDCLTVESLAGTPSPKKELQDLLAHGRGAAVIYRPVPPASEQFVEMLDHSLEDDDNLGNTYDLELEEVELPEEAVLCFPQGRFAEIRRIGFALAGQDAPKEIRFWVSLQSPKSGFEPLATLNIEEKPYSYQEFDVPPTAAKYLKIQIASGHSAEYINIREMLVRGYFRERALEARQESGLGEIKLAEKEPNDQTGQAQTLPLATSLGGKASSGDMENRSSLASSRRSRTSRRFRTAASSW